MRLRLVLPLAVIVLSAAAGAWSLLRPGDGGTAEPTYVAEHPVAVPEAARTVAVSAAMPMPSASPRALSAMIEQGPMPPAATDADVLTDTECVPDEEMVSRCRNELRLADGSTIVLRHPHRMAQVPCLAPGEHVRLLPVGA